jgi:hypothetical protein
MIAGGNNYAALGCLLSLVVRRIKSAAFGTTHPFDEMNHANLS